MRKMVNKIVKKKSYFNKHFNNSKVLYFILVLFIIISVVSFVFYFYYREDVSLGPVSYAVYTDLPPGFSPVLGYTHGIGGNRIVLWDVLGNGYVSSDGITFNAIIFLVGLCTAFSTHPLAP